MVNGHYIRGLGETEAEKAARKQAGRASRQAARGDVVTVPGYTTAAPPAATGGTVVVTPGAPAPVVAAPAPASAGSSIGDSISGFFSNIPPPVMIAGIAILGIILLKKR